MENYSAVEKEVHEFLVSHRISNKREFFDVSIPVAVEAIRAKAKEIGELKFEGGNFKDKRFSTVTGQEIKPNSIENHTVSQTIQVDKFSIVGLYWNDHIIKGVLGKFCSSNASGKFWNDIYFTGFEKDELNNRYQLGLCRFNYDYNHSWKDFQQTGSINHVLSDIEGTAIINQAAEVTFGPAIFQYKGTNKPEVHLTPATGIYCGYGKVDTWNGLGVYIDGSDYSTTPFKPLEDDDGNYQTFDTIAAGLWVSNGVNPIWSNGHSMGNCVPSTLARGIDYSFERNYGSVYTEDQVLHFRAVSLEELIEKEIAWTVDEWGHIYWNAALSLWNGERDALHWDTIDDISKYLSEEKEVVDKNKGTNFDLIEEREGARLIESELRKILYEMGYGNYLPSS